MARQVQQQSQIQEVLAILRRRIWQVILPAAFVVSLGISAAVFTPYKYSVSTTIELRPVQVNQFSGVPGTQVKQFNASFSDASLQIRHTERVRKVLERQDWEDYLTLSKNEQHEYLKRVKNRIRVSQKGGGARNPNASTFIKITYTDTNANRAEQFVNSLRDAYIEDVVDRYRREAREERDQLQELRKDKGRKLQEALKQLQDLRKEHGLAHTINDVGGGGTSDPVFDAYAQAQQDLVTTSRTLEGLTQRRETAQEQWLNEPQDILVEQLDPAVRLDDELQMLDRDIIQKRSEQEGLRPANSNYKKIEVEIGVLLEERESLEAQAREAVTEERWQPNPNKATLYQDIQTFDQQIADLQARKERLDHEIEQRKAAHDERTEIYRELAQTQNEVDQRRKAYNEVDSAYQRMSNFVQLISGPEGNPFELEEPAIAPTKPTDPNPIAMIAAAIFLGIGVGLGSSLLTEYSRSCYRSVHDIARSLSVPVLGAVNTIVTRPEVRRAKLRRLVVGSSSFIIIGTMLWVTWAWRSHPDLLGPELLQIIDDIRTEFR